MPQSTLSADAKDALAHDVPAAEHCREALRNGLLRYGTARGARVFRSRRLAVARLLSSLFDPPFPIRKVADARLRGAPAYELVTGPPRDVGSRPLARCDRRMELRGAFLACGSLAQPAHGYHLEFVPPTHESAERLAAVLRADGHVAHVATRRRREVLYFKDIDAIVRVLSAIGAYAAVLHLEDVRALKETKNRIHRLVNTEAANVDRAATAAAAQRASIALIAETMGLSRLSPALREAAELRLRHPTETLTELGLRCRPPAKKATVNGRIAALMRLARRLHAGTSTSAANAAAGDRLR